jgi:hypothetical protein
MPLLLLLKALLQKLPLLPQPLKQKQRNNCSTGNNINPCPQDAGFF